MAHSSISVQAADETDPRSVKIRRCYKKPRDYFEMLGGLYKYFDYDQLDLLDEFFESFLAESDYNTCLVGMQYLMEKVEYYWLDKANCKIAFNIGKLLDCFLTKYKHCLSQYDKMHLHVVITDIQTKYVKLSALKDTEYVIALVYMKHFYPDWYQQEEGQVLARLGTCEGADSCVKQLFDDYITYPIREHKKIVYFQFRSFVLIRNTMIINEDFIRNSMKFLREDYRREFLQIYACKMLSHVIVPVIAHKQNIMTRDQIKISDGLLKWWLFTFAELSYGLKIREDQWETLYDEDFAFAWQFVKVHATRRQKRNFHKFLIENGFEFHLNDTYYDCYVTKNNIKTVEKYSLIK